MPYCGAALRASGKERPMPLEVLKANFRKVAVELLRYLPNTISLIVTYYFIFLVLFFGVRVVGDPGRADENIRFLIVSTVSICVLLMIVMIFLSMLTAGKFLNLAPLPIFLVMVPTLTGIIGLGFMAGGLAIIFKQVEALLDIVEFAFIGLAFVPLAAAPWLEFAPVVKGIDLIRYVMINNLSLAQITAADWVSLLLNALAYFGLGLAVFLLCERRALNRGLLGQY
jgi:ABC-2 type transport system permease protein